MIRRDRDRLNHGLKNFLNGWQCSVISAIVSNCDEALTTLFCQFSNIAIMLDWHSMVRPFAMRERDKRLSDSAFMGGMSLTETA